jgi:hypothetical protein
MQGFLSLLIQFEGRRCSGLSEADGYDPEEALPPTLDRENAEAYLQSNAGFGFTYPNVLSFHRTYHTTRLPTLMLELEDEDPLQEKDEALGMRLDALLLADRELDDAEDENDEEGEEREEDDVELLEDGSGNDNGGEADGEEEEQEPNRVVHSRKPGEPYIWPSAYCVLDIDGVLYEIENRTIPFTFKPIRPPSQDQEDEAEDGYGNDDGGSDGDSEGDEGDERDRHVRAARMGDGALMKGKGREEPSRRDHERAVLANVRDGSYGLGDENFAYESNEEENSEYGNNKVSGPTSPLSECC